MDTVDYASAGSPMPALELHYFTKIVYPEQGRLPSVPGEADNRAGGGIYVLDDVALEDIIRHAKSLALPVKFFFLQIVTVTAPEVAGRAGRLDKNLKFTARFGHQPFPLTRRTRSAIDGSAGGHPPSVEELTEPVKE